MHSSRPGGILLTGNILGLRTGVLLARRAAQIEVVDRVSRDRVRARHAKRSTTAERRGQIATVTRDLVARYGIHGASLARIAHGVGVTDAALYRHFGSKEDMLIAAYDTLADRVFAWIDSNADLPVVVRLREMGESHAELFSKDIMGFNGPMFQFNVWLPDDGVRAHVDKTHRAIMDALVDLVEQGKAEGTVSPDVDAELIVDEIYAWIWWEDLSYLRGLDPIGIEKGSAEMFSRILKDIVLL